MEPRYHNVRTAEVGLSLACAHRGRGYAVEMIRRTCPAAARELAVRQIVATVFVENVPSCRVFVAAGFHPEPATYIRGRECVRLTWAPEESGGGC